MSAKKSLSPRNVLKTGSRVDYTVTLASGSKKRVGGQIAYGPGPFHLKPNENDWCGVILDEACGKNNGTIQGRQYFQCEDNHGVFVRVGTLSKERATKSGSQSTTPSTTPSMTPSSSIASFTGMFDSGHQPSGLPIPKSLTESLPSNLATSKLKPPTNIGVLNPSESSKSAIPTTSSARQAEAPRNIRKMVESLETKCDEKIKEENDAQNISKHALDSAGSSPSRSSTATISKENQELLEKVKDLESKLNTLMIKRAEDRAKLKDFERLKIQNDQLLENKKQMAEKMAELSKLKLEAERKAEEACQEQHQRDDDVKELIDSAEMAVIEKEMAENRAELLQKELEETKVQLEEARIDFELLKSEIEDKGADGAANSFQTKQMEEQIARYKEAFLKLRDITATDRSNIQLLQKEIETKSDELNRLTKEEEKARTDLAKCYEQIEDLKEQVDMALGSQEMVEKLTEKNLELEDRLEELQRALDEEENIKELNNMILEEKDEIIADLRDEVDEYKTNLSNLKNSFVAAQEAINDREATIKKFRELVSVLKEQNEMLRAENAKDNDKGQQAADIQMQLEKIEFKARLLDRKDHSRAVDMELRQLDVEQCYRYVNLLARFFNESFFARGGEHESIAVLLLVPRLMSKCLIVERQVQEKFSMAIASRPEMVMREMFENGKLHLESLEKLRQHIFIRHFMYLVCSVRSILDKYQEILSKCDAELFSKIGNLYLELAQHEKSLDYYVELLRSDKLDELVSLDSLEKTLSYFQSVYNIHMSSATESQKQTNENHNKLLAGLLEVLRHGAEALMIDLKVIGEITSSDASRTITQMETTLGDIEQFVKKIRRNLASSGAGDAEACSIRLSPTIEAELFDALASLTNLVRCFKTIRAELLTQFVGQFVKKEDEAEKTEATEEQSVIYFGGDDLDKISKDTTGNNVKGLAEMLTQVMGTLSKFSTLLQQGDFDAQKEIAAAGEASSSMEASSLLWSSQHLSSLASIQSRLSSGSNQQAQAIVSVALDERALAWRAQTDKIGEYRARLEAQENEIAELQRVLRAKLDETSEMQVRRDMAEKKLTLAQNEAKRLQEELERKVAEFNEKEAERERTLNKYNQEINELYSDKRLMKEKLKIVQGKSTSPNMTPTMMRMMANPNATSSPLPAGQLRDYSYDSPSTLDNLQLSFLQQQQQQMSLASMSSDTASLQQTIIDLRASLKRMAKRNNDLRVQLSSPERANRLNGQTKPQWYIETLKRSQQAEDQQKLARCIPDYRETKISQLRLKLIEFKLDYENRSILYEPPLLPPADVLQRKPVGWTRRLEDYLKQYREAIWVREMDFQRRYHQLRKEVEDTVKSIQFGLA